MQPLAFVYAINLWFHYFGFDHAFIHYFVSVSTTGVDDSTVRVVVRNHETGPHSGIQRFHIAHQLKGLHQCGMYP